MNFTTPIFIFVFFPIAVSVYLIVDFLERRRSLSPIFLKFRVKDFILIAFGMLFYMWACFDDIIKLGFYMLGLAVIGIATYRYMSEMKMRTEYIGRYHCLCLY